VRRAITSIIALALVAASIAVLVEPSIIAGIRERVSPFVDDSSTSESELELVGISPVERWIVLLVEFPDSKTDVDVANQRASSYFSKISKWLNQATANESRLEVEIHTALLTAIGPSHEWGMNGNVRDTGIEGVDGPRDLARWAVKEAGPDVNWSHGDLNNDGIVDRLLILHSDEPEEDGGGSNAIWSHFGSLGEPIDAGSKFLVQHYTMASFAQGGTSRSLGTITHEMMHQAGAIDLYDTHSGKDTEDWSGLGDFDIMASGNWNGNGLQPALPSAATLDLIGINRSQELEKLENQTLELTGMSIGGKAVRIEIGPQEFVWIEHRSDDGFDRHLPGSGILVTIQDKGVGGVDDNTANMDPERPWLRVIEADGNNRLLRGMDHGVALDLFTSSSKFGREGIQIRNHLGQVVPWTIEVSSINGSIAYLDVSNASTNLKFDAGRLPIGVLRNTAIPFILESNSECTPSLDLIRSDQSGGLLIDLQPSKSHWIGSILLDPAPVNGSSIQLTGTVNCGLKSHDIEIMIVILPSILKTDSPITAKIHSDEATSIIHTFESADGAGQGTGTRMYELRIEGPLSQIATVKSPRALSPGDSVTIEIDPRGMLSENMLALGTLVLLADGQRDEVELEFMTPAPVPEVPRLFGLLAAEHLLSMALMLMACWTILNGKSTSETAKKDILRPQSAIEFGLSNSRNSTSGIVHPGSAADETAE